MFEKTFKRGTRVTEAEFHDGLERLLRADPELQNRLTRRDTVAGGFDDLLHDDIIAELKVSRGAPIAVSACARYVGQPTQYGVGRGSQLSVLVVLDHGRKEAPPGVIDNYIDWLKPRPARPRRSALSIPGRGSHHQHQLARPQRLVTPPCGIRAPSSRGQADYWLARALAPSPGTARRAGRRPSRARQQGCARCPCQRTDGYR